MRGSCLCGGVNFSFLALHICLASCDFWNWPGITVSFSVAPEVLDHTYISSMASPIRKAVRLLLPGNLNQHSKKIMLVLLVEKVTDKREYKDKDNAQMKQYCSIVGIGGDGVRQDCVFFGESIEKTSDIAVGQCFGSH